MTTTAMEERIPCCGFTPCIQRILEFGHLEKGAVNRAGRVVVGIGGKGANTARMVGQLGGRPLLVGFAGGANGRLLERMLDEEGVAFRHVETAGETRICQTLVEAGHPETTELVEEMPPVSPDEWEAMAGLMESLDLAGRFVPVSGKLPAGAPQAAYARVCALAAERGGRVLLDAPGEPLLLALEHKPFLVKINDVELLQTFGGGDLLAACRSLVGQGAQAALITRGARTAIFMDGRRTLEVSPPRIEAVNAVGSGDAVTAGLAVSLQRGADLEEALAFGMACGAANALNLRSGELAVSDVERLRGEVRIRKID